MNELAGVFTNIAEAIRYKTGTHAGINPRNMTGMLSDLIVCAPVTEQSVVVAEFPSKETSLSYNGNLYRFFRNGVNFGLPQLNIDWARVTNASNLFENAADRSEAFSMFNEFPNYGIGNISFSYMFAESHNFQYQATMLFPENITDLTGLFYNCSNGFVENIQLPSNCNSIAYGFYNYVLPSNLVIGDSVDNIAFLATNGNASYSSLTTGGFGNLNNVNMAYSFKNLVLDGELNEVPSMNGFTNIQNMSHSFEGMSSNFFPINLANSLASTCDASFAYANANFNRSTFLPIGGNNLRNIDNISYLFYNVVTNLSGTWNSVVIENCRDVTYAFAGFTAPFEFNFLLTDCSNASHVFDGLQTLSGQYNLTFTNVDSLVNAVSFGPQIFPSQYNIGVQNCNDASNAFTAIGKDYLCQLHSCSVVNGSNMFRNCNIYSTSEVQVTGNASCMFYDSVGSLNHVRFEGVSNAAFALQSGLTLNNIYMYNLNSSANLYQMLSVETNLRGNIHVQNSFNLSDLTDPVVNAFANGWVSGNNLLPKVVNDLW